MWNRATQASESRSSMQISSCMCIIASLSLFKGYFQDQELMCEKWREYKQTVPSRYLTDVYDGCLWNEWATYNGKSFLQTPGNLLNVDWFKPFIYTQYSVGAMYLVIQNLPRAIRFKPENVIIVSTIPGPKEPD